MSTESTEKNTELRKEFLPQRTQRKNEGGGGEESRGVKVESRKIHERDGSDEMDKVDFMDKMDGMGEIDNGHFQIEKFLRGVSSTEITEKRGLSGQVLAVLGAPCSKSPKPLLQTKLCVGLWGFCFAVWRLRQNCKEEDRIQEAGDRMGILRNWGYKKRRSLSAMDEPAI